MDISGATPNVGQALPLNQLNNTPSMSTPAAAPQLNTLTAPLSRMPVGAAVPLQQAQQHSARMPVGAAVPLQQAQNPMASQMGGHMQLPGPRPGGASLNVLPNIGALGPATAPPQQPALQPAPPPPPPAPAPPQAAAPQAPPVPQVPQAPQQSVEQQALNGGGVDNKQQISNFMNALRNVHAGSNDAFMNAPNAPQQAPAQPLVNAVAPQQPAQPPPPVMPALPNNTTQQGLYGGGVVKGGFGAAAGGTALPPGGIGQPQQQPVQITPLSSSMRQNALTAMSDETQKEHVSDASKKLTDFMSAIGAHSYQYKSPELDGHGTFTSPMAQELQKTELGKQAVIETPRGLMVDYGRLGGVNLAAVSVVHREQQKLAAQVAKMRSEMRRKG
jgi:hypothetical protein